MAKERITEIDLLRTIAIIMMVMYHIAFDLQYFYSWNIDLWSAQWETFRIITVSMFLLVSGISSQLSSRPLRRALVVLSCALLISMTTYIYDTSAFIYFGILHCIGIGMLVLIPLRSLREWNTVLGGIILMIPVQIPAPLPTLDYYPPIPWMGVMLIGSGIGHYLYHRHTYRLHVTVPQVLTLPGRYSLLIYMIHQPIILGTLSLLHTW